VYGVIHAERASIPVARACRVVKVSRSRYYQWLRAEPSEHSIDDAVLAAEIKESSTSTRGPPMLNSPVTTHKARLRLTASDMATQYHNRCLFLRFKR
jgi:hypothetical protein